MAYTAKTISGAQARVRNLERIVAKYEEICARLKRERNTMAKLAADTPQFFNPIHVVNAKKLRDRILHESPHA
jgi:hypothetical protein